jgi:hypothetical protein
MRSRLPSLTLLFFAAALAGCSGGPRSRELRLGLVAAGHIDLSSEAATIQVTEKRKCQPPYPQGLTFAYGAHEPVDVSAATEIWYVEYTTCNAGDCLDSHATIGRFPDQGFKWGPWLAEDATAPGAPACE